MQMNKEKTLSTKGMVLCAMFTALIAIGAFLRVQLPISPVPYTLQFLFVNLAGLLLGRRRALTAVVLYIILGLAGVPIFSTGGGFEYIFRPTFGYILGFRYGHAYRYDPNGTSQRYGALIGWMLTHRYQFLIAMSNSRKGIWLT